MKKVVKLNIKNIELLGNLMPALAELRSLRTSGKVASCCVLTFRNGEEKVKAYEETRLAMLKASCKKDDKGEPMIDKNEYLFETEEDKLKLTDEIKLIAEQEVEIEVHAVSVEDVEKIQDFSGELMDKLMSYHFISVN